MAEYSFRDERYLYRSRRHLRVSREAAWTDHEVSVAYDYLTNPVRSGLWKTEMQWCFGAGITAYIRNKLEEALKDGIKTKSRKVRVNERQLAELYRKVESFSFLFALFVRLLEKEDEVESLDEYLSTNDETDLIITALDLDELRKQYKEALDYFRDNLYQEGFQTSIQDNIAKIKCGMYYIAKAPRIYHEELEGLPSLGVKRTIELYSLEKEPAERIVEFLRLLGKAADSIYYKVYSPEEEILYIYTRVTKAMLPNVVSSKAVKTLFTKMLSDYESDNATATISTAGQVGEECLTQIYETLHRKPVPQNMTLGALRDSISDHTKKMKKEKSTAVITKTEAQKSIKERLSNAKQIDTRVILQVSKIILDLDDANHRTIATRVRNLEGLDNDFSIFPYVVRLNLNNLLRLRNIVSHKSIDPVGMAEALQSVYYSLSLYMWWDSQRKKIDWSKDERAVIQEFISAASS